MHIRSVSVRRQPHVGVPVRSLQFSVLRLLVWRSTVHIRVIQTLEIVQGQNRACLLRRGAQPIGDATPVQAAGEARGEQQQHQQQHRAGRLLWLCAFHARVKLPLLCMSRVFPLVKSSLENLGPECPADSALSHCSSCSGAPGTSSSSSSSSTRTAARVLQQQVAALRFSQHDPVLPLASPPHRVSAVS